MDIICIEGSAPGAIVATLSHEAQLRTLPMTILRHPAGGWHVQTQGGFGPRCHAVPTAILLEASEAFAAEAEKLAAD
jgi:hypothetical protein